MGKAPSEVPAEKLELYDKLVATLPGVPLYRALGFADVEPVSVPLPDGLTLPCFRMERAIEIGRGQIQGSDPVI